MITIILQIDMTNLTNRRRAFESNGWIELAETARFDERDRLSIATPSPVPWSLPFNGQPLRRPGFQPVGSWLEG